MRAPGFWYATAPTAFARLLAPVSAVWAWRAGTRMDAKPEMIAPVPVICVGNFVAGGAGKTPTALAVANIARGLGFRVGFLTRGYGGRVKGPRLVAANDRASEVGDEPLLLAATAPTVVDGDRPRGAERLLAEAVDLIVMDDGFQNPSLGKDLSLVVADAATGIGNGRVMPAGPLRAPIATQLRHADAVIVVGEGSAAKVVADRASEAGKQVLHASFRAPDGQHWDGKRVLAFAGIARPEKFFASLEEAGAIVVVRESFPDHHFFGDAEARRLLMRAETDGLSLVTTEKDRVRMIGEGGAVGELQARSGTLPVELVFDEPEQVAALIAAAARRR